MRPRRNARAQSLVGKLPHLSTWSCLAGRFMPLGAEGSGIELEARTAARKLVQQSWAEVASGDSELSPASASPTSIYNVSCTLTFSLGNFKGVDTRLRVQSCVSPRVPCALSRVSVFCERCFPGLYCAVRRCVEYGGAVSLFQAQDV